MKNWFGKKWLGLVLVASLLPSVGQACSCISLGDTFEETMRNHSAGEYRPLTIVRGTVLKHGVYRSGSEGSFPTQMTFEVEKVLQGTENEKRISIKGDDGASCILYVSKFPVGTRWKLAMDKDEHGEYSISACGVFYQKVIR